jgi:hypothetical protein
VLTNELSQRAACERYHLGWHTLKKILAHAEPPGYRQSKPRPKRKLEPFLPIIHQILIDDRQAPKKQRHTAERIFERLRAEHGFQGGRTVVKDAVRSWKQSHQEVFLPLSHPPGEAQVDFGEATVQLHGVQTKVALFVLTLPYSGAIFIQAFPRECTETFLEGHRRAFEFFSGVPRRISYPCQRVHSLSDASICLSLESLTASQLLRSSKLPHAPSLQNQSLLPVSCGTQRPKPMTVPLDRVAPSRFYQTQVQTLPVPARSTPAFPPSISLRVRQP